MYALIYLQVASLLGLIRFRLLRLKQPKYLLGALVGVAYFYFFFVHRYRPRYVHAAYGHVTWQPSAVPSDIILSLWSLGLLMMFLFNWLIPRGPASLGFSEAEIAFLFPAPIRRQTLVHYCLLRTQLAVVFSALVLTLVAHRWADLPGGPALHALGWWIILATLRLHGTASSFVITGLGRRGMPGWSIPLLALALVALIAAATFFWMRAQGLAPQAADLVSPDRFIAYVSRLSTVLTHGPLAWVLLAPSLVVAPFLAPGWPQFVLALLPALLVLGAHYLWALLVTVSFEEASIARAEKRAARLKARQLGLSRTGRTARKARRARFRLAPSGRPEIAFLWKNLLATPSFIRPGTAFIAAAAIAAGCLWLAGHPAYRPLFPAVSAAAGIVAGYALVLGPQLLRYDLRADLVHAEMLKTYPLRGWQIILGELLTPVAILTVILWLLVLAVAGCAPDLPGVGFPARAVMATALALVVPPVCALQLLTPNALAVLFPAWSQAVTNRSEHGLEVLGQRLLFVGGQLLATLLALVPPAVGGLLAFFQVYEMAGRVPAALIAPLVALAILLAEVWGGIRWLGRTFERLDLSA